MYPTNSDWNSRLDVAWLQVRGNLLVQREAQGHWRGKLSSSALATATAISALAQYRQHANWPVISLSRLNEMIDKGCHWLLAQQNADGGWGDTDHSHSNVATTMLVVAALTLAGHDHLAVSAQAIASANGYLDARGRLRALRQRYGRDKTFAVPILANAAIAGLVPWREVPALPCEAVILPQQFYRLVRLPVVSYAIPALVAIGQVKAIKDPSRNPLASWTRRLALKRGLNVLGRMQPDSGGFLEAIPLTCFVAMSLAHSDRADHEVTTRGIRFVDRSFRDLGGGGGTWPIDTNLATWNTTLALNALGSDEGTEHLTDALLRWLLDCQYHQVHPFTGAAPGGWGWTDLSGSVPDADDTPGALLALCHWMDRPDLADGQRERIQAAAAAGLRWLLDLQNRDQGWPTFCRGWGRFPFDRSGNDITAHVIRALQAWQHILPGKRISRAIENGFRFLIRRQNANGSWYPLWFGNQDQPHEENPLYGTVKVLLAFLESGRIGQPAAEKGIAWLLDNQNEDLGWGGGASHERHSQAPASHAVTSSVQETALATELLARLQMTDKYAGHERICAAWRGGVEWLLETIESGKIDENWPIGFYFAKLWYYERLYPGIFTVSALRWSRRLVGTGTSPETSARAAPPPTDEEANPDGTDPDGASRQWPR
jgi:squalene-hopene/tetraprenyl-beta-curcumene cyclase